LQKKPTKKKQNTDTPNSQPMQSFSMPCYPEKTGGLPDHQLPAPNLLGRGRPTCEQISGMQYPHSLPWDKPAQTPGQSDAHPGKKIRKKLNKKQGTKKNM
jgi:hypothetical protein